MAAISHFQMWVREWIFCILIKISLKFVLKGPIDNIPALAIDNIPAWRRIGDKPLFEPMLIWFTNAYMQH